MILLAIIIATTEQLHLEHGSSLNSFLQSYSYSLKVCVSIKALQEHQHSIMDQSVLLLQWARHNDNTNSATSDSACVLAHHSEYGSWFADPESLDHLEHIHHSLCLATLNGSGQGTEYATTTHCITVENRFLRLMYQNDYKFSQR